MDRLTGWVLAHRRWVALAWLAVAVAGGALASTTSGRLSYDFSLPGQPAYETNQQIAADFGGGGLDDPLVVVARGAGAQATVSQVAASAESSVPGTRVVTAADPGGSSLTQDGGRLSVALLYPPVVPGADPYAAAQPRIQALVDRASAGGSDVRLTGFSVVTSGGSGGRGIVVEVLLGALGALVVLGLVFASLLAGVPLLVAAVSILATFLALLGLTALTDVSFVVQFLVALIGLGVAIDYSLLVVTRWREERSAGAADDEAVRVAMRTAGRSVLFSGVTVAISLAALVLVPVPFLRSIGLGGLLIPLFSVATTLTLLPVLLRTVGPRLLWPTGGRTVARSERWAGLARRVLDHRWLAIVASVVVLLALAAPVLGLRLGSADLDGAATDDPSSRAAQAAVAAGVPAGYLRPTEVVVPAAKIAIARGRLSGVDGVAAVVTPDAPSWQHDGRRLVLVLDHGDPASAAGRATLAGVKKVAVGDASVGGSPAEDSAFVTAVYGHAVWVLLAVVLVTFLLLCRALRSLWLPVKALLLNVVSIGAAFGMTTLVWQHGFGSDLLFGQHATGAITVWVPVAAFSFLFGLSMDYEVFLLARMRESYDDAGRPDGTDAAVVDGLAHTGRLVTSAALILFLAFVALSTAPGVDVKILATTLALGIAVDALVVRSVLAPALVGVLGRVNWVLPRGLARLLGVPLS